VSTKHAAASNCRFPKEHSKKDCVCGAHSQKAHREKGKSRYSPAMVRRIKRAGRGPTAKAPKDADAFIRWLNDQSN